MTKHPSLRGTPRSQPETFTRSDLVLLALIAPFFAVLIAVVQSEAETIKPTTTTPPRQPLACPAEGCLI